MTFSLVYAWSENYVLPISHDEVVHGKGSLWRKMPGDTWQRLANVRALLGYMWAHPGKQLLFMGCELARTGSGARSAALDWYLLDDPARRAAAAGRRPQPRSTGTPRRCGRRTPTPDGLPLDRRRRRADNVCFLRHGSAPTAADRAGLRGELRRRAAGGLPGRPAVRRHLARGAQHRRAPLRRLGRGQPRRGRGRAGGTACRPRRRCGCRRPACSGSAGVERGAGPVVVDGRVRGADRASKTGMAAGADHRADHRDGFKAGHRDDFRADGRPGRRFGDEVGGCRRTGGPTGHAGGDRSPPTTTEAAVPGRASGSDRTTWRTAGRTTAARPSSRAGSRSRATARGRRPAPRAARPRSTPPGSPPPRALPRPPGRGRAGSA